MEGALSLLCIREISKKKKGEGRRNEKELSCSDGTSKEREDRRLKLLVFSRKYLDW